MNVNLPYTKDDFSRVLTLIDAFSLNHHTYPSNDIKAQIVLEIYLTLNNLWWDDEFRKTTKLNDITELFYDKRGKEIAEEILTKYNINTQYYYAFDCQNCGVKSLHSERNEISKPICGTCGTERGMMYTAKYALVDNLKKISESY